jgi:hypothetical protein
LVHGGIGAFIWHLDCGLSRPAAIALKLWVS